MSWLSHWANEAGDVVEEGINYVGRAVRGGGPNTSNQYGADSYMTSTPGADGTSRPPNQMPNYPSYPGFSWSDFMLGAIDIGLDYYGAKKDREARERANEENIKYQKEFAQQGLQWRIEDARRAGINPLAAMGFGGASFSPSVEPVSSGDQYRALGRMGQNISRAAQANATREERAFMRAENELRLERLWWENRLLEKQWTNIDQPTNPAFPAAAAPAEQMLESVESPGHFFLMPSMEAAMASQGDYLYPLTNRVRKITSHYGNLIIGNSIVPEGYFQMPEKYRKQGFTTFKRLWDGTFVPVMIRKKQ